MQDDRNTDPIIDAKYQAMLNTFMQPDPHSYGVYKMLADIYPALAKKLFENNKVMEKLVMSGLNSMDILEYPVCGKCESLALYDGSAKRYGKKVKRCTCKACGASTIAPPTLRVWLIDEIRHKAPPEIAEELTYAVDLVALRLMGQATRDYAKLATMANEQQQSEFIIPSQYQPASKKRATMDRVATDDEVRQNNEAWEKMDKLNIKEKE